MLLSQNEKKCDISDGPSYIVEKSKIFVIKYINGSKDVINDLSKQQIVSTKTEKTKVKKDKVEKPHGKLYFGGEMSVAIFNQVNLGIIGNYKFNDLLEFDLSLGMGRTFYNLNNYSSKYFYYQYDSISYFKDLTLNSYSSNINLGARIYPFKNKNKIKPFIKPEIGYSFVRTRYTNNLYPNKSYNLISYNLLFGININKHLTISTGMRFMKIPAYEIHENYDNWSYFITSIDINKTKVPFNNLLIKLSYEF